MSDPAPRSFYAACPRGIEEPLETELAALGALRIRRRRGGAEFEGPMPLGYAACLSLRTATRVQEVLARGPVRSPQDLYELAVRVAWTKFIRPDQTLAVDGAVRDPSFRHAGATALTVKDAVVDAVRKACGRRPDVDRDDPDLQLKVAVLDGVATIGREFSGESLHKRGTSPIKVKSPLNESLAAGLLLLAGYDGHGVVVDPMCGSGTFLVEAARLATKTAPGIQRPFAFQRWIDFDAASWNRLLGAAEAQAGGQDDASFEGVDRHEGATGIAKDAVERAGFTAITRITNANCADFSPSAPPAWVFVNPPYGHRLGGDDADSEEVEGSWRALGNFLHQKCRGATAFVLCGDPSLTRHLGLRAARKWPVWNGPIECRWLRYAID